ncbi:MAG TPA: ABC transporter permease subunit [Gemmatimonadaceae bacterium]|nr:ABC transporter permease subunit [Gemmatimonadaceae bacterium]
MNTTARIVRFELSDVIRSRWLIAYGAFFLLAADALLRFSDDGTKAVLSLVSIVLLVIPLVSIVFGTMFFYNAREFTELLLAQPVRRSQLFTGLYLGLAIPLSAAFVFGVGVPYVYHGMLGTTGRVLPMMLGTGVALTLIFVALAYVIAVRCEERVRGLGAAIATWLGLAVLYDGLVLVVATMFADAPIERALVGLILANPVDLGRLVLLLQLDISALLGYTGAVFRQLFGTAGGMAIVVAALSVWLAAPVLLGARLFGRKDF